jgi:hypothetical protein
MSLIELAAEFFDRMANPVYGAQVNEEYTLRFARLMDDGATSRMAQEVREIGSVSALSPSAWSWLLGWVRTQPEAELDESVLRNLCEQWESTTFKAEVIRTALSRSDRPTPSDDYDRGQDRPTPPDDYDRPRPSIDSLPDPWLRELLIGSVRTEATGEADPHSDDTSRSQPTVHSRHAHSLLMALILVDTEESLDAAAALLQHPWPGQDSLLSAFWSRANSLEPQVRETWISRLHPPDPRG